MEIDPELLQNAEIMRLPAGRTHLGRRTLVECREARIVVLPDGLAAVGERWFFQAAAETVVVPASVLDIKAYAFQECARLR